MQALLDQHLEAAKQEARNIAKDFVSEPHLGRTTLYCWAFEPKGEHNHIVLDEERRFSEAERSEIYQAGELELPFVPGAKFSQRRASPSRESQSASTR